MAATMTLNGLRDDRAGFDALRRRALNNVERVPGTPVAQQLEEVAKCAEAAVAALDEAIRLQGH